MQTKSNIQLIKEGLAIKESFKGDIKDLMERYFVEDNTFHMNKNYYMTEDINGYFVINHEYTDLNEAVSAMNFNQSIRIINNERFQVGDVYEKLSNIPSDNKSKVYDISTKTIVGDDK